jgi:hypothetical protein
MRRALASPVGGLLAGVQMQALRFDLERCARELARELAAHG